MRIAFFLDSFPAISETFVLAQITGLLQRGHDVEIFAQPPFPIPLKTHKDVERFQLLQRTRYPASVPASWLKRAVGAGARLGRWIGRAPRATCDALNLFKHGRRALNLSLIYERLPAPGDHCKFDVVHCHFGPNGQRAVRRRAMGTLWGPILTSFHGYDANKLPRVYGAHMYEELFHNGELFTVGSEFMRKKICELGAPIDRIEKLPMGVDVSRFCFKERRPSAPKALRLLTIGRLVNVKGIEYALQAIALARDFVPGLSFRIAGDGPLFQKLTSLALQLGLSQIVEFIGAVSHEETLRLYSEADVFVLPSIVTTDGEEENQPVVLAEAQACGLPVIATAIGGIPESIRPDVSGRLVPPRDPASLAHEIRWFAEHPDTWAEMSRAGRKHVEREYNLEPLHERLVELYEALQPGGRFNARS